jgi:hypothetical protein
LLASPFFARRTLAELIARKSPPREDQEEEERGLEEPTGKIKSFYMTNKQPTKLLALAPW